MPLIEARKTAQMAGIDGRGRRARAPIDRIGHRLWVGLLLGGCVLLSPGLACATPFAALAALAATNLPRRDAFALVGCAWLANQIVGFGWLGYPCTFDTGAWGLAIGAAAMLATSAAHVAAGAFRARGRIAAVASSLPAAFTAYEVVLFAASYVLPSSLEAFSAAVIGRLLAVNLAALAGLLVLHRIGLVSGLGRRPAAAGDPGIRAARAS